MDRAFVALTGVGLGFLFTGIVMKGRAWVSRKAGDSELLHRMEDDARRYARHSISIGIPIAAVGIAGWFVTEWIR